MSNNDIGTTDDLILTRWAKFPQVQTKHIRVICF